jgi:hypothetical protein
MGLAPVPVHPHRLKPVNLAFPYGTAEAALPLIVS